MACLSKYLIQPTMFLAVFLCLNLIQARAQQEPEMPCMTAPDGSHLSFADYAKCMHNRTLEVAEATGLMECNDAAGISIVVDGTVCPEGTFSPNLLNIDTTQPAESESAELLLINQEN